MSEEGLWRVRLTGGREAMLAYLREHPPGCEHPRRLGGDQVTVDAFVDAADFEALRARGLAVEALFEVRQRMQLLLRQVSRVDRFAGGKVPAPRGLARE